MSLCQNGQLQAPINIKSQKAIQCEQNCDLLFYYRSSVCSITNIGNNLILDYDSGSYINYKSQIYQLERISFTIPCSNKIDNSNRMIGLIMRKPMDINHIIILLSLTKKEDFFWDGVLSS